MPLSLDALRSFAVARSLFPPVSLKRALEKLQFVQANPIRAPARAQDLTLRHRVANYRAFMSDELKTYMKDSGVQLIGYRAIREALRNA